MLMQRNRMYREAERESLEEFQIALKRDEHSKAGRADQEATACLVAEDKQWSR